MIDEVREQFNTYGPFERIEHYSKNLSLNWREIKSNQEKVEKLFNFLSNIDDDYKQLFVITLFSQVHLDEGFNTFYKAYLLLSGKMKKDKNNIDDEINLLINNIKNGDYSELNDIIEFYKEYKNKQGILKTMYYKKEDYIHRYNDIIKEIETTSNNINEMLNQTFLNKMKKRKALKQLKLKLISLNEEKETLYNKIIEKEDGFTDEQLEDFIKMINTCSSYYNEFEGIPLGSINYIDVEDSITEGTFFFEEMNNTCLYIQKLFDYQLTNDVYSLLQQIRGEFNNSSIPANGNITDFRSKDIKPADLSSKLQDYYYKGKDVKDGVERLNELYKETISIQNEDEYIKGVLKFINEFILVHPYDDGNGRTSRTILATMLADRGIFLPSVADSYLGRKEYKEAGDKYFYEHDIEPLYNYILNRIDQFKINKSKTL